MKESNEKWEVRKPARKAAGLGAPTTRSGSHPMVTSPNCHLGWWWTMVLTSSRSHPVGRRWRSWAERRQSFPP